MSKADFVSQIYQAGLAAGLTDAAARVMASQAAIESAYGEKAPGNNYFGIKAGKSWSGDKQLLTTHEVVNGKRVKIKDWFRSYPTVEEGIADRVDFMASRFPEFNTAPDMGTALDALQNGKYGKYYTDDRGKYESSVNTINTKYLDGSPVPPSSVGGVASELSVSSLPSAVGRGVAPAKVPLPRPRPEREFDPLPFPGPLVTPRSSTAERVLGASAGNRSGLSVTPSLGWKNGEVDPATSAGNNVIPASDYQAARNLGGAGDPRLQVLGQPRGAPVVAPSMAETRAEQRMAPTRSMVPPAVARPGAGVGAVAGMGGVAGGAGGVVPMPANSGPVAPVVPPAVARPAPVAAAASPAAPSGGNILGAIGGGINFLGSKAQELGSTLGNTAVQAKDAVVTGAANMADKTVDAIIPQAMQSLKVRTAFIDPILARGFTDKPGYTIKDSPTKYGKTQAERQEAAAKRQALMDGKPYVPSTGVKSQIDVTPAMFKGTSTGRTYTVGKTYQSSRGPVIATANGFQPAGAATKPSAKQSRSERFTNLDSFGNII